MSAETIGLDIYMRYTDVNGKTTVREQRTWDKELLIASRQDEAAIENSKQKAGEPRKAKAEQITREQYLKERK